MNTLHDVNRHDFASDNYAGVHPDILAAIAAANDGHLSAYGEDPYTERLELLVRKLFGENARVYPVFNGTGANVISLAAITPRWGSVITTSTGHTVTDEGGAPEHAMGLKLTPVETEDGKLTPGLIAREAWGFDFVHRSKPSSVSLAQTTELGTVYEPGEIAAISEYAHSKGLLVHLDGARIWNAAAALGTPLSAFTSDAGVDVFSIGGTKIGALGAEAIVVLNPAVEATDYIRKFSMQLASKMRFISAQLLALFDDDLGLTLARQANDQAARLRAHLESAIAEHHAPGLSFTQESPANTVLAAMPTVVADELREQYHFYDWDRDRGEVRWMTAFDTSPEDVDAFAAAILRSLGDSEAALLSADLSAHA